MDLDTRFAALHGMATVGGLVVLKFLLGLLGAFYRYYLRPSVKLSKLGKYAVVTGATDGIGKSYAVAMARRGMSVILISRTESKLKAVAEEIDSEIESKRYKYPNVEKTKYIVCDYSNFDAETRDRVAKELDGLDVGVLINNVGQSYRYPRYFHELPPEEVSAVMEMNVNSTVHMTEMVIEGMAERKRGAIVNLSSGSAEYTMPLLAEYAAAKRFVESFSVSLDAEYKTKGVRVQCQIPFYVATKLAKLRKSLTVPTAEAYVWMAMRWVGHGGVVQPYWIHGLQGWIMHSVPHFILEKVVIGMHAGIRKRGLKKDARIAAEGKKD